LSNYIIGQRIQCVLHFTLVADEIKHSQSGLSRMQLDESTDAANVDQLLDYVRYAHKNIKWEFKNLFSQDENVNQITCSA